nr:MAG TPA: hypothetical protein [Caudoviricetes sp.]
MTLSRSLRSKTWKRGGGHSRTMSVFAPTYSSPTQPILSCRNAPAGSPLRLARESEWRAL